MWHFLAIWVKFNDCRGGFGVCQLLSDVIRSNQKCIRMHQKHIRDTSEICQRYVKMHQKTPVFLIKYCHNKELRKIKPQINADSRRFFLFFIKFYFTQSCQG